MSSQERFVAKRQEDLLSLRPGVEIDDRTQALVRLGAAIAQGAPAAMLRWLSEGAMADGASIEEIVGTLVAVGPIVGSVRLVKGAPDLALAIGYDIERALEEPD